MGEIGKGCGGGGGVGGGGIMLHTLGVSPGLKGKLTHVFTNLIQKCQS